jgi:GT2 family glycosyltransferase
MKGGIVVTTKARPVLLARCLEHLTSLSPRPAIVVADNDPAGMSGKAIAERFGVDYCFEPRPGLSRSRNRGARAVASDILIFIDDDMVPHGDWYSAVLAAFDDDRAAAVGYPVLPMNLLGKTGEALREWMREWPRGPSRFEVDLRSPAWMERTCFGGVVQGSMAFRRTAFASIGGFDERLGRGCTINHSEENYAFFRLVDAGFYVAYTPDAMVFHLDTVRSGEETLEEIAMAAAYLCFLAWHHPVRALRISRYCVGWLRGQRRDWRVPGGLSKPSFPVSRGDLLRASVRGPGIFIRSLWRNA